MFCIGLDPGGIKAFGWCVVDFRGDSHIVGCDVTSNFHDALLAASEALAGEQPAAIGIDAPLFWSIKGERRADLVVRAMVKPNGHSSTVNHVNSLRGACLVQGILAAARAAENWPGIQITEAHPKALHAVSDEAKKFAERQSGTLGETGHVRDAGLAAFAAYALVRQTAGWQDLAVDTGELFFPVGLPVRYWFPCNPQASD